jgi:hypothetical protein
VEEIGGDFDIATGIIVNPDLSRYCDWVNIIEISPFSGPITKHSTNANMYRGSTGYTKFHIPRAWNDDLGFYQEKTSLFKEIIRRRISIEVCP